MLHIIISDTKSNAEGKEGRYLMSRYSNSGTKENHAKLSFWSKQSIRQILLDQRMSFCLHRIDTPFCGDGIVQEGEVSSKAAIYM